MTDLLINELNEKQNDEKLAVLSASSSSISLSNFNENIRTNENNADDVSENKARTKSPMSSTNDNTAIDEHYLQQNDDTSEQATHNYDSNGNEVCSREINTYVLPS